MKKVILTSMEDLPLSKVLAYYHRLNTNNPDFTKEVAIKEIQKRAVAYRIENGIKEKAAELYRARKNGKDSYFLELKEELDIIWKNDPENIRYESKFWGNTLPNGYYSI